MQVFDLAGGEQHQAAKDGALLRDQERRESDSQNDAHVFAFVAGQRFPRMIGTRIGKGRNSPANV
ncbi:MAG TPA: hypothetical protein VNH11_05615 [Pirellulales bacterium]|nr:hypothetical protein [Pirellulales bacterium]